MLKYALLPMLVCLLSCNQGVKREKTTLDSAQVLEKSIQFHDPKSEWDNLEITVRIQEPRLGNPERFSIVTLNNPDKSFELVRNRGVHRSRHIVDKNGAISVFLDDVAQVDEDTIKKYRLDKPRVLVYKKSYFMQYGLPMALTKGTIDQIGELDSVIYNKQECYRIPITLKEAVFTKHWLIYIAKSNFEFKGMEIIFPEDETKGERLYFEGTFSIGNIKIPRTRHWHELSDDSYSGTDIIIKTVE